MNCFFAVKYVLIFCGHECNFEVFTHNRINHFTNTVISSLYYIMLTPRVTLAYTLGL